MPRLRATACLALLLAHTSFAWAEDALSMNATVAVADRPFTFGMLEARFPLADDWSLLAAVAYLESGAAHEESQLRLGAVWATSIDTWRLESRHSLVLHSNSLERYRMRLRVIRPGLLGNAALSARAYDELFVDFDRRRLFRNNVAIGLGIQITDAMGGELYHMWERNRSAADEKYLLALLSVRFE